MFMFNLRPIRLVKRKGLAPKINLTFLKLQLIKGVPKGFFCGDHKKGNQWSQSKAEDALLSISIKVDPSEKTAIMLSFQ